MADPLPALMRTDLPLPHRRQGKVRDIYDATLRDGRSAVLLVATDRLSAFDVVMPQGPAGKGRVLNTMSAAWFDRLNQAMPDTLRTHALSFDADAIAGLDQADRDLIRGRVTLGTPTRVIPIECVARGYLAGSGWKEYREQGTVCGQPLPPGLTESAKLPEPIFTPATKAQTGHDENITFEQACAAVGRDLMFTLRDITLAVYAFGAHYAAQRGILVADTKLEFGLPLDAANAAPMPILIDEVLTPDSSRFWPADRYEPGRPQDSFDKQYVRDYLQDLVDRGVWNKQPPGPDLPQAVLQRSAEKYREALDRLNRPEQ